MTDPSRGRHPRGSRHGRRRRHRAAAQRRQRAAGRRRPRRRRRPGVRDHPQRAGRRCAAGDRVGRHIARPPWRSAPGPCCRSIRPGLAIDAGATFLVMPHTDPELVAWAAARGVPTLPGAAHSDRGAGRVACRRGRGQALPGFGGSARRSCASAAGRSRDIPLVPSGGVTAETAADFIRAGAVAVGVGSWLIGDAEPPASRRAPVRSSGAMAAARAAQRG